MIQSKIGILKIVFGAMVLIGLAAYWIADLTRGPSTKEEVCASFEDLGQKTLRANGIFDNAVFSQAEDLADVTGRYEGNPSLAADAQALKRIADSSETNTLELMNATRQTANLCGHSLLV